MTWGGKRNGAGRRPIAEKTKMVRVPLSLDKDVKLLKKTQGYRIPVFSSKVPAGNPSPADGHIERYVNVMKALFPDPINMGVAFADGTSMINVGIFDGTPLIVHRTKKPEHKDIVIGILNGGSTVKRLLLEKGEVTLKPENDELKPYKITEADDFKIDGVVTNWLGKKF